MLDLTEAFDFIEDLTRTSPNVSFGITGLLDYCASKLSNPAWSKIKDMDFDSDVQNLSNWLRQVLLVEPPSDEIKSFWFGLYNPVRDGKVSCGLYISGSMNKPDEPDWAVWNEKSYLPESRYADSMVLPKIYALLVENAMHDDWEYVLCLGYASLAVRSIYETSAFKQHGFQVAVGFDEGDYIILDGSEKDSN